jgi:CPA2 family monovalent cation:H+ antiporter-2
MKTIFMAIFFVSVGLLVDLHLVKQYVFQITLLVFGVFITNTFLNACILRFLKESWVDSLYAASFLSQIGEFSFVLVSIGYASNILGETHYKILISVIAISLIFSPLWIIGIKKWSTKIPASSLSTETLQET